MLLSLKPEQFMEMVRDVGITPWGHRHKLREALDNLKETTRNDDDPIEKSYQSETCNVESSDSLELFPTSFSDDACDLCAQAKQHRCTKCGIPVCNLKCSEQDPSSDIGSTREEIPDVLSSLNQIQWISLVQNAKTPSQMLMH